MASTITDARIIATEGTIQQPEVSEGMRSARNCLLNEMPGLAAAIVTLAYIVHSFARLAF